MREKGLTDISPAEFSAEIPKIPAPVFASLTADLRNAFQFMAECGVRGFDCSPESLKILKNFSEKAAGAETLSDIRKDLGDCRRCKLSKSRTQIVFGAGNSHARLLFAGEGPGYEEDRTGQPFVGNAGQLLNRIIAAIKMKREDVYICNAVKCRPPRNRNPEADEIAACLPFLERQIAAVRPEFICTLGKIASQALLRTSLPMSSLRGRFHPYKGIRVIPTYHPAFLLRYPDKKRETWEDMKMLMKEMGTDL